MVAETSAGGAAREFPETAWSRILSARESVDARRGLLGELLETYWKPLYFHARRRGLSVEAAKDAVQGFCVQLLELEDFLARLDPAKGRLRSFLRASLDRYVSNLRHDAAALKRGGGRRILTLDVEQAEGDLASAPQGPEAAFEREWAFSIMERAIGKLGREFEEGSWSGPIEAVLRFFRPGEPPSYSEAAAACGKTVSQFKVFLHRARVRFRRLLREEVARTVADERDIDAELAELRRVLSA